VDVTEVVKEDSHQIGFTPNRIQVDNGSEFISKALDHWAYVNQVTLDFSRTSKSTLNITTKTGPIFYFFSADLFGERQER